MFERFFKSKEQRVFEAMESFGNFKKTQSLIVKLIEGASEASLKTPPQLNINAQDKEGNTFLHYYGTGTILINAKKSCFDSFAGDDYLIQKGADANILNNKGEPALKHLISSIAKSRLTKNKASHHQRLIKATSKQNLNKVYHDGETILTDYIKHNTLENSLEIIPTLVQAGVDVNLPNGAGNSPLKELISRIITLHLKPLKNSDAVYYQKRDIKRCVGAALYLIEAGAKITLKEAEDLKKTKQGNSVSSQGQIIDIVMELATDYSSLSDDDKNIIAQKNLLNIQEKSDLFDFNHSALVSILLKDKFLNLLQTIDIKNKAGQTPLFQALQTNSLSVAQELIKKGANLHSTDNKGNTLLHAAAQSDCIDIVNLILQHDDIFINTQNHEGNTPLHLTKSKKVFRKLVQAGADYSIKNKRGQTPIDTIPNLKMQVFYLTKQVNALQEIINSSPVLIAKHKQQVPHEGVQNQNG